MTTATVIYKGQLITESVHHHSGNKLLTDAPVDNNGRGSAFSPTDLLATSLAQCILTTMGIVAQRHAINIDEAKADVTKIMVSNPRRVGEIIVTIQMPANNYTSEQKQLLERTAHQCPVAKSLHPEIQQQINFIY